MFRRIQDTGQRPESRRQQLPGKTSPCPHPRPRQFCGDHAEEPFDAVDREELEGEAFDGVGPGLGSGRESARSELALKLAVDEQVDLDGVLLALVGLELGCAPSNALKVGVNLLVSPR